MQTRNIKRWRKPQQIFKIFLVFIVILYIQLCYLSLFKKVYGIDMQAFAKNRNTYKSTIKALRGNIYASDGSVLAQTVTSYTVIAYLSETRTANSKVPLHVVDKEKTASLLSPILDMTEERLLSLLSRKVYQVELGPGGRGITELKKEEIEALELPGIDFIKDIKRYYPNGNFASYIVGYSKKNDNNELVGELGIEALYNEELKGNDGFIEQQQDRYGYKIPDTPEINKPAVDGKDVYLTIDSGIQRFLEKAIDNVKEESDPVWFTISVMEAKTGKILGSASLPSYNPNILNISNYENPLVSFSYEPGSVMKIFTYLCAMENNVYNGNQIYKSGSIKIGDNVIYDHNKVGWGEISYDLGFERSSNVAVANMMQTILSKDDLKSCLSKYGFGQKTGINLPRELTGSLNFNYDVEIAAASYGQGILTTPIQQFQALSIIANDGTMIKPTIVDKIVDPKTGKIVYESKIDKTANVVSKDNTYKIKNLMYNVVNSTRSGATGKRYKIDGYDVIGKTGTAQIYNTLTGKYSSGSNDYIYSFSGMFPKEDPDVIIFASIKQPKRNGSLSMSKEIVDVMKNVATYRNTFNLEKELNSANSYTLKDYRGQLTVEIEKTLKSNKLNVVTIGNGNRITMQYPTSNITVLGNDSVFLVTDNLEIKVPNFKDWAKRDVVTFCTLTNTDCEIDGYGYVFDQSLAADTILKENDKIIVKLKNKE